MLFPSPWACFPILVLDWCCVIVWLDWLFTVGMGGWGYLHTCGHKAVGGEFGVPSLLVPAALGWDGSCSVVADPLGALLSSVGTVPQQAVLLPKVRKRSLFASRVLTLHWAPTLLPLDWRDAHQLIHACSQLCLLSLVWVPSPGSFSDSTNDFADQGKSHHFLQSR